MNSQDILLLNVVAAVAFLMWYAMSRSGGKKPTQLDMKANESERLSNPNKKAVFTPSKSSQLNGTQPLLVEPQSYSEGKAINVIFIYEAQSWDAYEVLGVPAGSSLVKVTEAYQNSLRNCDKQSVAFIEAAYKSILQKVG